jgi:hypothetical protein
MIFPFLHTLHAVVCRDTRHPPCVPNFNRTFRPRHGLNEMQSLIVGGMPVCLRTMAHVHGINAVQSDSGDQDDHVVHIWLARIAPDQSVQTKRSSNRAAMRLEPYGR